jgi:hypothetical protein
MGIPVDPRTAWLCYGSAAAKLLRGVYPSRPTPSASATRLM